MKTSAKYVSLVLAAGAAGATLFTLAGASFTAAFHGDVIVAVVASVAVVGFAAYDYSRRTLPLKAPVRILRPAPFVNGTSQKTKAYGIKPVREERLAA
jgi:hypothetical protein